MEKRTKYLVIGCAVILAIAFVLNFENITGLVVKEGQCIDSDGGKNYFEKGITIDSSMNLEYTDYCIQYQDIRKEARWLKEYSCSQKKRIQSDKYLCLNGCLDGICLK